MKITNIQTYHIRPRWMFLKIETDEGICGWGEPLVEGRADTVRAAVLEWKDFLIGRDPLKVEEIWQSMYRGAFYRGGPVLMSTMGRVLTRRCGTFAASITTPPFTACSMAA